MTTRNAEACLERICREFKEAVKAIPLGDEESSDAFCAWELPDSKVREICLNAIEELWEEV